MPAPAQVENEGAGEPPRGALEQQVATAMAGVLGVVELGRHDNFFERGGHSLLAAWLVAQLGRDLGLSLPLAMAFEAPSVAGMAEAIQRMQENNPGHGGGHTIPRLDDRSQAPLSLMQQRVWYLEQLNPGRVVYNTPSAHRLRGVLDAPAFERALRDVVRHQPVLRTVFEPDERMAIQRIHDDVAVDLLPAEDLSGLPAGEREERLHHRLAELIDAPFDLARGPLFRVRLFRLGDTEHVFFFMPHHLIWDGWSFDLLYEEMSSAYAAACAGQPVAAAAAGGGVRRLRRLACAMDARR